MNLSEFLKKYVIIKANNGKVFRGKVIDWEEPWVNENDKEAIIVDDENSGKLVEFYEDDIIHIGVIK